MAQLLRSIAKSQSKYRYRPVCVSSLESTYVVNISVLCRRERLEEPFKDKKPHLYKLVINPDNTFAVSVDHKIVNEGSLFTDFEPPVNPPKEIDDPNDKKPESWDEREKVGRRHFWITIICMLSLGSISVLT